MCVSKGMKRILQGQFQKRTAVKLMAVGSAAFSSQVTLPHSYLTCESQFPCLCNIGGAGGDQAGCKD